MLSNITYWLDETTDRFPDKIGYVDGNGKLTFSETKIKALNLANMIVQMGLFKKPIAIYMEKSTDALVSFFAVAYSGNFYSPIDVTMPESRIIKIFECLQPELIITKKDLLEIKKYIPDGKFICMDDVDMVEQGKKLVIQTYYMYCLHPVQPAFQKGLASVINRSSILLIVSLNFLILTKQTHLVIRLPFILIILF